MPATDSPAILVARFLKANHYNETLEAFLKEAGLPADAGNAGKGDLTIERVLEEKKTFDLSVQFEKLGTDDVAKGWTTNAPGTPSIITTLPTSSNILHTSIETLSVTEASDDSHSVLLATTADRRLNILDVPSCTLRASETTWHGSPILCCTALSRKLLLTTSMNGDVLLSDLTGKVMDRRRDHLKYVVRVAVHHTDSDTWVATAGWDSKVHLYRLPSASSNGSPALGAPVSTIPLTSNPESLLFLTHPDTSEPVLLLTRRDSTFLHYYSVPSAQLLGRQNLAPHSNAWIAFTPSAIAPCPTDSSLLAVATSAVPHMKLIIVRLLFPSPDSTSSEQTALAAPSEVPTAPPSLLDGGPSPATIQARAALALQDREAAAIQIHCTTLAPQTHYSTPALAWRPDGSGVWVNGDDGAVRGIETASGKIVATLKGGHEGGSKVRCLWAGSVPIDGSEGEREEWLVSGGFDQKLIVWKPE